MMLCEKCGTICEGGTVCPNCGEPLKNGEESALRANPEATAEEENARSAVVSPEDTPLSEAGDSPTDGMADPLEEPFSGVGVNSEADEAVPPLNEGDGPRPLDDTSVGDASLGIGQDVPPAAQWYQPDMTPAGMSQMTTPVVRRSPVKAIIIAVAAVVVLAVIATVTFLEVGKANLKRELMGEWSTVESGEGGYYMLELDFSEDTIEYNFLSEYSFLNTTIATLDYRVVAPNKIKIKEYGDDPITISFNDDKSMMIVSPAITDTKSVEYWFR